MKSSVIRLAFWLVLGSCMTGAWGCTYRAISRYPDGDSGPGDGGGMDAGDPEMDGGDAAMDADADSAPDERDAEAGIEAGADADTDAGPDVVVPDPPEVLHVEPLFAFAPQWNDYAFDDRAPALPIGACPEDEDHEQAPCINGGPFRKLELEDESSCTGLTADDDEGWFDWICEPSGDHVRLRNTGLTAGLSLRDLVDPEAVALKPNFVVVRRDGVAFLETASEAFWTNEVVAVPASSDGTFELAASGTIYVIKSAQVPMLRITSDKVSLIDFAGTARSTHASNSGPLLSTEGERKRHVWIEHLSFDAASIANPIVLSLVHSSVDELTVSHPAPVPGAGTAVDIDINSLTTSLTDLESSNAPNIGVRTEGSEPQNVTVRDAGGDCMVVSGVQYSEMQGIDLARCNGIGLELSDSLVLSLSDVRISNTGQQGILATNINYFNLADVYVADAGNNGIELTSSTTNITLEDATSTNNQGHGMVIRGKDHRVLRSTSSSNEGDGIQLSMSNGVVMYTTTAHNTGAGVSGGTRSLFVGVVSVGNETGFNLPNGAEDNRVRQLFATDNTVDVAVGGARNAFFGELTISSTSACSVEATATGSGIADTPACMLESPSMGSIATATAAAAFVGQVAGSAQLRSAIEADGWFLASRWRHWGKAGAFAGTETRGPCGAGDTCAIWDWRVMDAGPIDDWLGPTPFAEAVEEAHILQHTYAAASDTECSEIQDTVWNEATSECTTRFIDYGYEGPMQLSGHDGLCWFEEWCTLYRNLGAYPGEGELEAGTRGTVIEFTSLSGMSFQLSRLSVNGLE